MKGDDRQLRLAARTTTRIVWALLSLSQKMTEGEHKNHNAELIRGIPRCLQRAEPRTVSAIFVCPARG